VPENWMNMKLCRQEEHPESASCHSWATEVTHENIKNCYWSKWI